MIHNIAQFLYEHIGKVGCQKQVNSSGVTMRGPYEVVRLVNGQEISFLGSCSMTLIIVCTNWMLTWPEF